MEKYLTISSITKYLKFKLDTDDNLKNVYLKGEISNFKSHSMGHLYFSLKDENSKINAIMFSLNAKKLKFSPSDGLKVLVTGRISVYEPTGNYQIYVEEMEEDGLGNLYIEFEKLKEKLSKEGLFSPEHKKKIPKIPEKIGIITAPTGAAIKDILSTLKRRFPYTENILFPSLVQGENAKEDIVSKIKLANTYDLDLIILGRGGGSIEDLWPFNEEVVARAIYESKIPIVSAVGHEVDYTIADFVADLRAPTPTGAAEMVTPNIDDIIKHLNNYKLRLNEFIYKEIKYKKLYLESIKNSYIIKNPMIIYENKKQNLLLLVDRYNNYINNKLNDYKIKFNNLKNSYILNNPEKLYIDKKQNLYNLIDKLELINPLNTLKRGYSLVYKDKLIKSIKEIKKDDILNIKLSDGSITAIVKEVNNEI